MNHEQRAKDIIEKILYITIATSDTNNKPWNSPVYSAYDTNYNFYWASWKENQHSKNIAANPNIFLVIYDSTVPEGTGFGVYVQCTAKELVDESEIKEALSLLYTRKGQDPDKRKPDEFMNGYPRRIYKAVPEKFWVNGNDKINENFIDNRIEIQLP